MYSNSKEQISLEEAYKTVYTTEEMDSLVDLGQEIVQNDNPSQVKSELAKWAFAIGEVLGDGELFMSESDANAFISSEMMSIEKFKNTVSEIEQDLRSDEIQKLKGAQGKKVKLLRVLDNNLIKKAAIMGLLSDPNKAFDRLERDVDKIEMMASEIKNM